MNLHAHPTPSRIAVWRTPVCCALALLATACGGGGGGSGGSPALPATGAGSGSFQVSRLGAWPTLAARCAQPRSGTDPVTGKPYPDRAGSILAEQDWLASWTNDTYLWYADVSFPDPAGYSTPLGYFNVLKSPLSTPSGSAKDRFHFTQSTASWEALAQSGVQAGYGVVWDLISTTPPRQAVVAYVEPGGQAASLGLARGTAILSIDGIDLVNDNTSSGINTLNAGLSPAAVGETHTFVVQDLGASTPRSVTLTAANVTIQPVPLVTTLPGGAAGGPVGYVLFNDQVATAESALIAAIRQLQAASVTDLVLDIRYNGGGFLEIASELAYMIAGPAQTAGKIFETTRFNDKHPSVDPVTGQNIVPLGFLASGNFDAQGQALPTLGLSRVFVLTGSGTCSASEAIINGLRGAGVQVIQIGARTCGKPYGFYPADNCGTTYFSIQFQGTNQLGFGNYPDGFTPQNGNVSGIDPNAVLPGCSVGDDFTHALGDGAEARLGAALGYRFAAACPVPSGVVIPGVATSLRATEGVVVKAQALSNRILRVH